MIRIVSKQRPCVETVRLGVVPAPDDFLGRDVVASFLHTFPHAAHVDVVRFCSDEYGVHRVTQVRCTSHDVQSRSAGAGTFKPEDSPLLKVPFDGGVEDLPGSRLQRQIVRVSQPLGDRVRVVKRFGDKSTIGASLRGLSSAVCPDHDQECRRRPRSGHPPCDLGWRSVRRIGPCGGCSTRYFRSPET